MKHMYSLYEQGIRACADTMQLDDDTYLLTRVEVGQESRGQGHGATLLRMVTDDADREKATLVLCVYPDGSEDSLDFEQLSQWYARYGFVRVDGHGQMKREPR